MNISLPDELKVRMDGTAEPVNWSSLAARAFEVHLGRLAAARDEKSAADVVDRLRASRLVHVGNRYGEGLEVGMRWAREVAEWPDLERLEDVCGDATPSEWETRADLVERATAALDEDESLRFWALHAGEANPPAPFVHGFCDGALSIFEDVRRRL